MAITIRKRRTNGKGRKKKGFDFEFSNRVLFGFSVSVLLMLILVCIINPAEDHYGFIGFIAWTLGWLIASQKNVRGWAFWEKSMLLAVTAPIFAVLLILFIWSFACPWCHNLICPEETVPTVTPPAVSPTAEIITTSTDTPTPTPTITPTPSPEPSITPEPEDYYTFAIVDLMLVPRSLHGNQSPRFEAWNEYVEIYNYGDADIDLEGLWLTDGGGGGQPDQLGSWDSRFASYDFPIPVDTSSTIIRAGEYGLILSGQYINGDKPYDELMGHNMRAGSTILTIAKIEDNDTDLLGDYDGLECRTPGSEDFVVIYHGTGSRIDFIVASYGQPVNFERGMNPGALQPPPPGTFPVACGTWGGVRISDIAAVGDELQGYWEFYPWAERSPGY